MDASFKWDVDPFGRLDKLQSGLKNKAIRIAMNKASAIIKAAIISGAPSKYGFLRKSIRIRVRNYQNKNVWVSIVGAKADYRRNKGKRTRGKHKGDSINHRPALYARLLELGTKHATGKPFLKPALDQNAAAFQATLCSAIEEQVQKLLG